TLYYEVRGSGPVLLMMPGGPADAGAFRNIAQPLASHYTVVTYDPRGLSHSTLDGPLQDERIVEIFADDVHRLLSETAKEPADVFGSSGGAVIGLELAARHPEQVRTLVSHEPPAPALLADPARERAAMAEIVHTFRTAGIAGTRGRVATGRAARNRSRRLPGRARGLREPCPGIRGQAARGPPDLERGAARAIAVFQARSTHQLSSLMERQCMPGVTTTIGNLA